MIREAQLSTALDDGALTSYLAAVVAVPVAVVVFLKGLLALTLLWRIFREEAPPGATALGTVPARH